MTQRISAPAPPPPPQPATAAERPRTPIIGMVLGLMLFHGARAWFLPLLFILAGALGTARLLISDHTPAQIYVGAAIGLAGTFGCLAFGIYY